MIHSIGPQKKPGALAPLLLRLIDGEPDFTTEALPYGTLTPEEVKQSVFEELERLLNTRNGAKHATAPAYGIAPHFGLENFSPYEGTSPSSWKAIEISLQQTIQTFEPRLRDPQVRITGYHSGTQSLKLTIGGTIFLNNQKERVSFTMGLGTQ